MSQKIQNLRQYLDTYRQEIKRSAEELLQQKMPVITEELFCLFEKNGNRLQYEAVYFTRRKLLAVFGMEAILEKEWEDGISPKILLKLCQVIEDICKEECWALPAHVNRKEDPDWRITADLFACETAQTLSELADRLCEELPEEIRKSIVQEVERRVFQPFFTSAVPYRNWECCENNWNAVCAGSIGSACLHLKKEIPGDLEERLKRICDCLPYYVKGFSKDGACMEGLGYYTYGMTYFVNFAQELYAYSQGEQDLLWGDWAGFSKGAFDKRVKMARFPAKCFFPDGRTLSFSDGNSRDTFRMGIFSVLAMHYPEVPFPNINSAAGLHTDSCYRFAAIKMDLLETREYLDSLTTQTDQADAEECREEAAFYVLPDAQWCIGHAANGVGFACKGGTNGESHNHNDVGHFLCEAGVCCF